MDHLTLTHQSLAFPAIAAGPTDGDLVMLLHGFPQTSRAWSGQIPSLAAAGWRAVAPDLRGFAAGALPETVGEYTQEHIRSDVFAIANQLGAQRFHLVGHDLGGIVAWDIACRRPERIRSLTVVSTPHLTAFAAALDAQQPPLPPFDLFRQPGTAERQMLSNNAAALRTSYAGLEPAAIDHYVAHFSSPSILTGGLNHFRAFDYAHWRTLPAATMPTQFIWGSEDPYLADSTARATRDHVTGPYTEVRLDGIGHWVPELAPIQMTELLLKHLQLPTP
ncbi:MAG TPA: alpha/beta hydrolase [Streptosporangiaceae bacterium]|nr:alpha/beta hydrolase [Streptosporangiaceae bacterium]